MIRNSAITSWHEISDGIYRRTYVTGLYAEERRVSTTGTIGDNDRSELTLYLRHDVDTLEPGDYVCHGIVDRHEPPRGARRIESISRYATRMATHHIEVKAR